MKNALIVCAAGVIFLAGCGPKTTPNKTVQVYNTSGVPVDSIMRADSIAAVKAKEKAKVVTIPKVIMVSDKYAKRTVDGRYYYDARGKRYWKNFKDGKYYIYNKSMYTNPDFKAP